MRQILKMSILESRKDKNRMNSKYLSTIKNVTYEIETKYFFEVVVDDLQFSIDKLVKFFKF